MNDNLLESVLFVVNSNIDDYIITNDQIDDNLSQFGIDSIKFISIIVALEQSFDVEISDEYLLFSEMDTITKIINVLKGLTDDEL